MKAKEPVRLQKPGTEVKPENTRQQTKRSSKSKAVHSLIYSFIYHPGSRRHCGAFKKEKAGTLALKKTQLLKIFSFACSYF